MASLGGIGSFFKQHLFSFALGTAAAPALEPFVRPLVNDAWAAAPSHPIDPLSAASVVAEDVAGFDWGVGQAEQSGISAPNFAALYGAALSAPELGELYNLWRRGEIDDGGFIHGLRKTRLEERWDDGLRALKDVRLAPAEVANAIQQGFLPGDGILPAAPSGPPYAIPVEQVAIDPELEAAAHGVDPARLKVLAELVGLPPGPVELSQMLLRGVIGERDFLNGIREGHTKTKWGPALKYLLTHPVLSAREYAELRLRGWLTPDEAAAGGALTGYSPEQMDRLYENRGRPATPHQMWLAIRRDGATRADFDTAIRQSNIRPEYADWLWAIRFSYPSLFQLRGAVEAKSLTPQRALTILSYQGYEDQDAQALVTAWTATATARTRDLTQSQLATEFEGGFITEAQYRAPLVALGYDANEVDLLVHLGDAARIASERDRVVTALHKLYIAHSLDDATVSSELQAIGVADAAITRFLPYWRLERDAERKQLTPAQIKRAYKRALLTLDVATAELEERGYDAADAALYLAE